MAPAGDTRNRIVQAADELLYSGSVRDVSVDSIAERANVTKRTLYYHFRSKDDLVAACLDVRDVPTIERYKAWAGERGPIAERVEKMFLALSKASRAPEWKGCGFIRAAVELADSPGHPALDVARRHKAKFEAWLRADLEDAGYENAADLACMIMVLLDGAVTRMLVDREPAHAAAAGAAARRLLTPLSRSSDESVPAG